MASVTLLSGTSAASTTQTHPTTTMNASNPVLVIGSLSTAQDGKYQTLLSSLEGGAPVERQMLDRLLDGGAYRLHYYSFS
jgi:anamorsin